MARQSAGIVVFRRGPRGLEFLLVHPGGPYWAKKDEGAWSVPKGELGDDEDALEIARRELEEETGLRAEGPLFPLRAVKQRGGKLVSAWGVEGDLDPAALRSNTFTMEWPPRSGRTREFPEVDRAGWFTLEEARSKLNPAQMPLLEELTGKVEAPGSHELVDHTSEVTLRLRAPHFAGLLEQGSAAFADLVPAALRGEREEGTREFHIQAGDPAAALVEWLNEMVYLCDTCQWLPTEIDAAESRDGEVRIRARGEILSAPFVLVKAATLHGAFVRESGDGLEAEITLDI